ncbi:type IV pilus biogenesis protein PilM [Legionella clemsonensis]|uniref:Competence protein A n=1 Tax=Legionella clemsonensis TaxID=1867846 RepID=A0A222P0T2_9GAMM|nr:type IV pilus assembly protein PilM [Legionella clemsonensis]ASQ45463.1 Competence protein A [Legionella clemsonensis]
MFKRFRSRYRPAIGVDITPAGINILQISQTESKLSIENFASEILPPHAIVDNQFKNIDVIAHCLKKIISTTSLSGYPAILAVPDSAIVNKLLQIDKNLPEESIEEAVYLEASKQFNYPLQEVSLDYSIAGPSKMNKEKLDIFITACRAEYINQRIETISRAGLSTQVVEPESNAIERIILLLKNRTKNQEITATIALIKINQLKIQLYVIKKNKTFFIHEELLGNHQWIAAFGQSALNKENILTEWNMQPKCQPSATNEDFEIIIRQIKKMLQFFYSAHANEVIEHLFLAGERELLAKLCLRLPDKIKIPVSIADPFADMLHSARICSQQIIEKAPSLLIACGLALRGSVNKYGWN